MIFSSKHYGDIMGGGGERLANYIHSNSYKNQIYFIK